MQDSRGRLISVGMKVRVLAIDAAITNKLPEKALGDINSMLGGVFEVYEIDEHQHAWVEKWWGLDTKNPYSHSLALINSQIEIV